MNEPSYVLSVLRTTEGQVERLRSENAALRQVLIALRVQMKADGHAKWKHPIARVEAILNATPHEPARTGGETQ